jgi:hypothetical protein
MFPHPDIHGRGDQYRLVGRQQRRGREIARQPGRHLRQDIGRCRGDHHQIDLTRQADMAHLRLVGQRPQFGIDLVFRQGRHRQRRDELRPALGQDTAHRRAALAQAADQFQAFIGRDPAGNDQQDALAVQDRQVGHGYAVSRRKGRQHPATSLCAGEAAARATAAEGPPR